MWDFLDKKKRKEKKEKEILVHLAHLDLNTSKHVIILKFEQNKQILKTESNFENMYQLQNLGFENKSK